MPLHYSEKVGGKLVFLCSYEIKELDMDLSSVYKYILITWSESKETFIFVNIASVIFAV